MENEINELEINSKNKNIRDLFRGINEFKKGNQSKTDSEKMRMVICMQIPAIF
jgi:hypothetical protein